MVLNPAAESGLEDALVLLFANEKSHLLYRDQLQADIETQFKSWLGMEPGFKGKLCMHTRRIV